MILVATALLLAQADSFRSPLEVFTSTREVLGIWRDPRHGFFRVVTSGGILMRDGEEWTKHLWPVTSSPDSLSYLLLKVGGEAVRLKPLSIHIGERHIELPLSSGSHISAATVHDGRLLVGMFGDGVFALAEDKWQRVSAPAADVTALLSDNGTLWLGTRRNGAHYQEEGRWVSILPKDEIPNHNIQALAWLGGKLYACTLEDGLLTYDGKWETVRGLSSNAPRQVVFFRGGIYVRHGTGAVDVLEGRPLDLPRKQATAMASDGKTLFVGQWGGWSEFDGSSWKHRFEVPELKGVQVTSLAATASHVWVGTQGEGLLRVDRKSLRVKVFDEGSGLGDDWITALGTDGSAVLAGTFAGPLSRIDGERITQGGPLGIRSIGAPFFVTSRELWQVQGSSFQKVTLPLGPDEIQAVCATPDSFWIGCRIGLFRMTRRKT